MPKLAWNTFIDKHSTRRAYIAKVSARVPQELDKNGRKLPTPYGLFIEWCNAYLTGDWSTLKVSSGFLVCVTTSDDAKAIEDEFKKFGEPVRTPAAKITYPIGYRDRHYGVLAGDMGYVV